MTSLTVAALQLAFSDSAEENIAAVSALVRGAAARPERARSDAAEENIAAGSELVRDAAGRGAKLILPPELFEGHYFCRTQDEGHFTRALPAREPPAGAARRRARGGAV